MEWGLLYRGLGEEGEILFFRETLFIGDSERYLKEGSGNGQLFPYGPRWGSWREFVYRILCKMDEGGLWKRSVSFYGSSARGPWREGSFTGDPERYVNAVERGISLHRGLFGEPGRGIRLQRTLRERVK